MLVELDTEHGTSYVVIRDAPVARTVAITELVMVDVDAAGRPVGVEMLGRPSDLQDDLRAAVDRFHELKETLAPLL